MSPRTTTCCRGAPRIDNVLFPLEVQGALDDAARARAQELIGAVGLAGFERYYPHELSGGMRKRAALIRTLVYDPPMILMDEPFAAVDAQTRTQLQEDLLRLWSLKRKTIIFVTHDITEAIALGDRALVLSRQPARIAGRARDPDPAAAQRQGHLHAAGLSGDLRAPAERRAMSSITTELSESPAIPRQWIVTGGRLALAIALLLAWEWGARAFGPLFFAPPLATAQRIVEMAGNGKLVTDIAATLARLGDGLRHRLRLWRAAAIPAAAVAARHRGDRAVHRGLARHPEIRADALADPVVRHRRRAEGDRGDAVRVLHRVHHRVRPASATSIQRLIAMARVIGASERTIARKVIWISLLPFFFTGLKVALPRAVSAAIVGEFLVATEGVGFSIERARQLSDTTGVFAGIVVAVALVLVINAVVNALERHALRWRPTDRDMQL